jgi:putative ATPase
MLGQTKLLGPQAPWRRLIEAGQIPNLILWGPPGTGKTTFALLLAQKVDAEFTMVNAVETGAKALRELGEQGRVRRLQHRRRTLVFIDEIHRLNKGQQDVLLPPLEKGDLIMVGATTENPSYEINSALLSRCRILVFERLSRSDLVSLAERACLVKSQKLFDLVEKVAADRLFEAADGDGRKLINLLETLLEMHAVSSGGATNESESALSGELTWPLSPEALVKILDAPGIRYDKAADEHHDTVSAFIKSVRGSDPNAAVYYLARMIKGGEDPVFIARRLVILASEDVGNADPRALQVAISGLQAVELVGWPEAAISLSQVTTYLASAPKSNRSYLALQKAKELIERTGTVPIPLALRSALTPPMKELGYGRQYRYSHEGEKGYIPQRFLPEEVGEISLYEPSDHGFEKTIRQYLEWLKS